MLQGQPGRGGDHAPRRGPVRRGRDLAREADTGRSTPVEAGLHPTASVDGLTACSRDMLPDPLAACADVTLRTVATALVRGSTARAEDEVDVRGTLGVNREAPIGFSAIRLAFELDTDVAADEEQLAGLLLLAERHYVVDQTLRSAPPVAM